MKRIFVLTGGGLSPTLNPTLYGVISAAQKNGWTVVGGLYGWASLLRNGKHVTLNHFDTSSLKDVGGTILRSTRTNPLAVEGGLEQVKERIKELDIDAVVVIGGNDTLGAAHALAELGVPIVGVPKTIDNDLSGTYFTPGYPSAAHYLATLTKEIKEDAAYAMSRIFVIESLGMKAGWLAEAGVYGAADVIVPPEKIVSLKHFLKTLNDRYIENGNYAVVVVSQEAKFDEKVNGIAHKEIGEQYGHARNSFICMNLKDVIQEELGIPTKAIYPGNFLESGKPIPFDRDFAIALGQKAIELVAEGMFGHMAIIEKKVGSNDELTVSHMPMRPTNDSGNYRPFPEEFFDWDTLLPTPAFEKYITSILGPKPVDDENYKKLIQMIAGQS